MPEAYKLLVILGDDFCGLLHSALSLVRQRIHAVRQSTRLLEGAGDSPDSAENCGVSAVRAALLCLCSRPSQQWRWFLRCHGLRAFLATVTLLRRASLCRVSWGVWRKVSSPEVFRLFFFERRMRCGFVWCSSYSSQWTAQVPGSFFLDKDVDVPVLATSWVVELIMAMVSFLGPCTQVHGHC